MAAAAGEMSAALQRAGAAWAAQNNTPAPHHIWLPAKCQLVASLHSLCNDPQFQAPANVDSGNEPPIVGVVRDMPDKRIGSSHCRIDTQPCSRAPPLRNPDPGHHAPETAVGHASGEWSGSSQGCRLMLTCRQTRSMRIHLQRCIPLPFELPCPIWSGIETARATPTTKN